MQIPKLESKKFSILCTFKVKNYRYKMENVSCIKYPLEDDTEATDIR
jgi:hypothetical protein